MYNCIKDLFSKFILTSENFFEDTWKFQFNTNIFIRYINDTKSYEIFVKNSISPCLYYIKHNDTYVYSFNKDLVIHYMDKHGINNDIYKELQNYSHLYLYLDHYDISIIDKPLFSIPIEKSGPILLNWANKYKSIFNDHKNELCIELSSGFDTRILTYFWRCDTDNNYHIYTSNSIKHGINELEYVSKYLLPILPIYNYHIKYKKFDFLCNFSGKDAAIFEDNDKFLSIDFLTKFKEKINKKLVNDVCPFLDKDLFLIKSNRPKELKCLLFYIFVDDVLKQVPIITNFFTDNHKSYCYDNFNSFLKEFNFSDDYFKDLIDNKYILKINENNIA